MVGSTVGGLLVVYVAADAVKLLLGCVLIGSALRVFGQGRGGRPGSN